MSLNLGLENLQSGVIDASRQFDLIAMLDAEDELRDAMADAKEAIEGFKNFCAVVKTVRKHGSYTGFESLIADKAELDAVMGCDICTVDSASVEAILKSGTLRDTINHFLAKIDTAIGRVYDRVANFVKTTLPFKEKYLKEMTEAKQRIAGQKFDEEKFQNRTVASALTKEKFNRLTSERKKIFTTLMAACKKASVDNINAFLKAGDEMSDTLRTSIGSIAWRPYLSWFKRAKVSELGFKSTDVQSVLDHAIAEIHSIVELNTWATKALEQYQRCKTEISQLRASGNIDEAIEKRGDISRLSEFFYQLWEGAFMYDALVRREMYFATYLSRALLQSTK